VRTSLSGRPSTAVSSAYASATTPVSAMAAPRRPLPPHATSSTPAERRAPAPVPSKAPVPAAVPQAQPRVAAPKPAQQAPARATPPAPVAAAPRPAATHSSSSNSASRGHLSATPLVAHSSEHIPAGLAATLEHIVGQLDLITKTMGVMEERLTLTESRVSGMIAAQRASALQQQKAQHPDPSAVDRTEVVNVTHTTTTHTVTGAPAANNAAVTNSVPATADLRTIQLRVMCRQRGLDASGTEAELLKRLNDAVAAAQYAGQLQPSSSAAVPAAAHEGYLSHSQINHSKFASGAESEDSGSEERDEESGDQGESEGDEEEEQDDSGYAEEVEQSGEGYVYSSEVVYTEETEVVYTEEVDEEVQFYATGEDEGEFEEVGQYDSDQDGEDEA